MEDVTRLASVAGIVSGLIGLISLVVAIIVVLATGRSKASQIDGMATQMKTLEMGNTELRAQNSTQEAAMLASDLKLTTLDRDLRRMTDQLTQRAAVGELAANLTDMRLEFSRRFDASEKDHARREEEAVERHKGVIAVLDRLLTRADGPSPTRVDVQTGGRRRTGTTG